MIRALLIIGIILFYTGSSAWAAKDRVYEVIDLGTLGGNNSYATGINDSGEVVGGSAGRAFLYTDGTIQDIGPGRPTDINNAGEVVINSEGNAFLYSEGTLKNLGTLGGSGSSAFGINNAGKVVGWSYTKDGLARAFLYENGKMKNLGTFGGNSYGRAINNAGRVTGYSYSFDFWPTDGPAFAFLYFRGKMKNLGGLSGNSFCYDINDRGEIVGAAWTDPGDFDHAMLYSEGKMQDLGTLGGIFSYAWGINNRGEIVGSSENVSGENRPFFYSNKAMRDLNDLIVPGTFFGIITSANDINDRGQIAATATMDGHSHAVLLNPVSK